MLLRSAPFFAMFFVAVSANADNRSGRALGELVLAEKLGIDQSVTAISWC
jgi:hypothetical protein